MHHATHSKPGLSAKTVHNRHMLTKAFLTYCGVTKAVIGKGAPKFEKRMPEIYEDAKGGIFRGRVPSLTPAKAIALRTRITAGESKSKLAVEFGISRASVHNYRASS